MAARLGRGELGVPPHRAHREHRGEQHRRRHHDEHVLRDRVHVAHHDLAHGEPAVEQPVQRVGQVDQDRDQREAERGEDEDPQPAREHVAVERARRRSSDAFLRPGGAGSRRRSRRQRWRMPSSTSWKSPPRVEPDSRLTRTSPSSPTIGEHDVGRPHRLPGRHQPPVGQALPGGEPDVVDREDQQPAADHQPDAAPREPQRHHDPDDHERDAGHADRPLLVDLDRVAVGPAVGVLRPVEPRSRSAPSWKASARGVSGVGSAGAPVGRMAARDAAAPGPGLSPAQASGPGSAGRSGPAVALWASAVLGRTSFCTDSIQPQ